MKLSELTVFLESLAPLDFQEDYDNSGLIAGNPETEVRAALISLDCTEAIVEEAIKKNCNLIISHHPILFRSIKKLNGKTYVERVLMKAIKNDISLYAIHTNFDNVLEGVNARICKKLGLVNCEILRPKTNLLKKLVTFCPTAHAERVRESLFIAGAGNIGNYSDCSYNATGFGTFKAGENTNAFIGEKGVQHREEEIRIEVIYPGNIERKLLSALHDAQPYEEVAFDLYDLSNVHRQAGSGMVGWLEEEMDELSFLKLIKEQMQTKLIRHTDLRGKKIRRAAVCGGAGGFLLQDAIMAGADIFITSDYKYHDFFDADGKIVIADVGHYESEQFTKELLLEIISESFPNFALHLTEQNTNPINYLI